MLCPNCGTGLPDNSIFCGNCGTRLDAQPVRSSGLAIKGSLMNRNQPAPHAYTPPEAARPTPRPYIPPETIPAYNTQPNVPAYTDPEIIPAYGDEPALGTTVTGYIPRKKMNLTWLWILLAVIVLGGAVIGVLFLTGVLGGVRYQFVEEAVCYDGNGDKVYSLDVELNDDGLPDTVEKRYTSGEKYIYEFSYDSKGNVTEISTSATYISSYDGSTTSYTYTEEYNEYGHIVKSTTHYSDGTSGSTEYDREYDDDGNVLDVTITYSDGSTSRYTYEYDKNGNMLESVSYENGEKSSKTVYEYDEHDNETFYSYTSYDPDYNYTSEYTYENEYDGDLLIEQVAYDDGEKWSTSTYEYDQKDRLTEEKIKYTDGDTSVTTYEYDDDGNLIEERRKYNGEERWRYEYEYDDDGNMTEQRNYEYRELSTRTEYSYYAKAMKLTDAQINIFEYKDIIHVQEEE